MPRITTSTGQPKPQQKDRSGPPDDTAAPVHAFILLDRSGSMEAIADGVIEGVNTFITEQAQRTGPCRLTLVQFDSVDPFEVVLDGKRIAKATPLTTATYQPRSTTPLYDAIGSLIEHCDARAAKRVAQGSPAEDHVIVIVTDGLENASSRWSQSKVNERIAERQGQGWTFAFLGANQDSYATGAGLGVGSGIVSNWSPDKAGVRLALASAGRGVAEFRTKSRAGRVADREDFFGGRKEAEEDLAER